MSFANKNKLNIIAKLDKRIKSMNIGAVGKPPRPNQTQQQPFLANKSMQRFKNHQKNISKEFIDASENQSINTVLIKNELQEYS